MKHYVVGAALILVIAVLVSVGPSIVAQNNPVPLNIKAPKEVETDKTPVLAPGDNIRPFLVHLASLSDAEYGGFLIQKSVGGPVYAFLKNPADEKAQISLFEYDDKENEFWWYDCSVAPFDTETRSLYQEFTTDPTFLVGDPKKGILSDDAPGNFKNSITADEFITYYACDVDNWTNDPEYTESKTWLENLSIRDIILKSTPAITKIIKNDKAPLATIGQGNALQQSEDDLVPGNYSLDNSVAVIPIKLDATYRGDSTGSSMPFGHVASSSKPIYYVVRDEKNDEQYLIQIWRFFPHKGSDTKEYVKMGIRLLARGDAGRKALWPTYTVEGDAFEISPNNQIIPASTDGHGQDLLMLIPRPVLTTPLTTELKFKNGNNRGEVKINIEYNKALHINKVIVDASDDLKFIGPRPLRLKFSQDMIAELIKNPSFSNAINDSSKIYEGNKVRIKLSRIGEPDVAFTTILKTTTSGGTPTNIPEVPYFKSDPIKPNDYVMEIEVDGFKPFTRKVKISSNSLSTKNDALVTSTDVKEIEKFPLLTDPCTVCKTIAECLACVDNGIVTSYEK